MSVTEPVRPADIADDAELQINADGQLRHLLTLRGTSRESLTELLDLSETFLTPMGGRVVRSDALRNATVANLFFEPSTRTRASFDLAAKRMGAAGQHLSLQLEQHGVKMRAVAFGCGDWEEELVAANKNGPLAVAFKPIINHFRGRRSVEMHLADWREQGSLR